MTGAILRNQYFMYVLLLIFMCLNTGVSRIERL